MVKHLQKIILAAVMLIVTNGVWAYDFQVGGIYYNITNDTAVPYTVEVTRGLYSYNNYSDSVVIPTSVSYNSRTYSVTSIGTGAFSSCPSLIYITIPTSVTRIGEFAFNGDTSLTSITIPNSVTSIGKHAFQLCSGLTSLTIPNSVVNIEHPAFNFCCNLSVINVAAGNNHFRSDNGILFNYNQDTLICYPPAIVGNSYNIPNSVTCIDEYAFNDCSSLTSVTIGNSVTSIESRAFYYCTSLTSITLPNSITSIGDLAFGACHSLTDITFKSYNPPSFGYYPLRCTTTD